MVICMLDVKYNLNATRCALSRWPYNATTNKIEKTVWGLAFSAVCRGALVSHSFLHTFISLFEILATSEIVTENGNKGGRAKADWKHWNKEKQSFHCEISVWGNIYERSIELWERKRGKSVHYESFRWWCDSSRLEILKCSLKTILTRDCRYERSYNSLTA